MADDRETDDRVTDALEWFKLVATEVEVGQRTREKEDLQFQVPELQWTEEVKTQRGAHLISGMAIPARPMLSIPKLDQPIQLVLNQERAAHLGVQVHPLNEEANDDTAEVIQGLYRQIEVDSRANLARSWAFERAVKCGRGCYRVLKEYDPNGGHPSDQRIVIKRILEQGRAYFDPFAQEPDWSDGERAMLVDDLPWRTYKRKYPKSTLATLDDSELTALGSEHAQWVTGDSPESRTIRVAEWFTVEYQDEPQKWTDKDGKEQARANPKRVVKWCVINAVEVLDEGEWEGQYIPLIPVIGRELIPFDGQRRWVGIISNNKDAQRLFNYAASGSVEQSALETKASHAIDPEAIEGFEEWWKQKNTRNFPYLPYKRMKGGRDLGEPVLIQADMSKMQVNMMLLQQAGDFLHAGTGAFEPTLGQQSPNVRTKGATLALQQQHDQGNSNWLDNLAEISLTLEAKIVLDLLPYVYDRPGRIARILDTEDNPQTVMLNQQFVPHPQTKRPTAVPQGVGVGGPQQGQAKHYDLTKGRYGVSVTVGKAYHSRVEQGADELGQLFQAEPQLFSMLGDIYLKFRDFPGHLEASERIKKMLPPQLQDKNDPQAAAQQAEQMQGQIKQLTGQLQQAVEYVKTEQAKYQAQLAIAKVKESATLQGKVMDNATKVLVARISAAKEAANAARENQEEAIALNQQLAADSYESDRGRAHEVAMAEQAHAQAMSQAQQAHDQASMQAEQGAGLDAGLAEQGQQHALEQGDQAGQQAMDQMAAAPQPEAGA